MTWGDERVQRNSQGENFEQRFPRCGREAEVQKGSEEKREKRKSIRMDGRVQRGSWLRDAGLGRKSVCGTLNCHHAHSAGTTSSNPHLEDWKFFL